MNTAAFKIRSPFNIRAFLVLLAIIVLLFNTLLFYRAAVLWKSIQNPDLYSAKQVLQQHLNQISQQIKSEEKAYQQQTQVYTPLLEQIFPRQSSSTAFLSYIDNTVLSIQHDISLLKTNFLSDQVQVRKDYVIYPIQIQLSASKESLYQFLDTFQSGGILDDTHTPPIPFVTVQNVSIEGDLSDQYDISGNSIPTIVKATILLYFYGQPQHG
jgi:hypothetical protein